MLRSWDAFTLLVAARPWRQVEPVFDFAHQMNFDPILAPRMPADRVNRFNIYPQPYHHQQVGRLAQAYARGREHHFSKPMPWMWPPSTTADRFPTAS